ncbi:MAG TPA: GIY-YIG nuclease family protein [Acetobacteraceae bacterium]|nr:GIY-YIG nuclease family protein [Acetobacteraceae bacterium]
MQRSIEAPRGPYVIYGIYEKQTNYLIYIGQTHDLDERWAQHRSRTRWARNGARSHLYAMMSKHGIENYRIEPIQTVPTLAEAYALERSLIEKFGTFVNGCNMTEGGETPSPEACRAYAREIWQRPEFQELRKRNARRRRRARLAAVRREAKAAAAAMTNDRVGT